MRIKNILLSLLACLAITATAQPTQQATEWEWYLDEVVSETFVGRNYFEYYYMPSAADMEQQRAKGEVSYFLNSPAGLNSKKVRDMIDRLMASYDDIKVIGDWHMTSTTYWKEFRYEKNRFRFSVKRKALDDGTYYVSVTETADYYKSLGKKGTRQSQAQPKSNSVKEERPSQRSTRDRKPIVIPENKESSEVDIEDDEEPIIATAVDKKEQQRIERERRLAERQQLRDQQRREKEKQREEAKALKEAEKQKKAEEKKQRQEEERLKREEKKRLREQEQERQREERAARRQQITATTQQLAPAVQQTTPVASHYHYNDIALWLSEKYDFTLTRDDGTSCTMYSTAVKDVEMAKLAIKNALKGSNARMAVPWRVNEKSQAVETGYTVDDHVLVFAIGKNGEGQITLAITEVSNEQFELFKQTLDN